MQIYSSKFMYTHGLIMHSPLELVSLRSIKSGLKILESKSDLRPNRNPAYLFSWLELAWSELESTRLPYHQRAMKCYFLFELWASSLRGPSRLEQIQAYSFRIQVDSSAGWSPLLGSLLHLISQISRAPIKLLEVLTNLNLEPVEAMLRHHPRTTSVL